MLRLGAPYNECQVWTLLPSQLMLSLIANNTSMIAALIAHLSVVEVFDLFVGGDVEGRSKHRELSIVGHELNVRRT